tara:strand:- start:6059 stop:9619 length:3561 start_codon:yes stop_codon:yes gene_type:complete
MSDIYQKKNKHVEKIKIEQKEIDDKISIFIKEYESKDNDFIEEEAIKLVQNVDDEETELRMQALRQVVDDRLHMSIISKTSQEPSQESEPVEEDFLFYPDKDDEEFNTKIYNKKEFNKYIVKDDKRPLEVIGEEMCSKKNDFELTFVQHFVKNFMSPNTPYNGILLIHGTGVGKTCASISIAEQFKHEINKNNRKMFVLLSPSIRDNFIKNIFDVNSYFDNNGRLGCTGNNYLQELGIKDTILKELRRMNDIQRLDKKMKIQRKLRRLINKYYKFMGYDQFANVVLKQEKNAVRGYADESIYNRLRKERIRELYSNTLIIIDEAHNLRMDENVKFATPVIERVLKYATNVKLVLLSATPMYDKPQEILTLLNYLLLNDNRPKINKNSIFDKKGNITESGKLILINKSRGYISYVRGESPYNFPLRIYPENTITDFPLKNMKNRIIKNKIKHLKIIDCPMTIEHYNIYMNIKKLKKNNTNIMTQVSNIIWNLNEDEADMSYGRAGLQSLLDDDNNRYSYRSSDVNDHIFRQETLHYYSSKISSILKNIETTEGIIYIYSQFIDSGVIPIALALEQNGYNKYGTGNNLLTNKPKMENKGNYIIISSKRGPNEISSDNRKEISILNSNDNKDGKLIKIVIGSPASGEGLDLLRVREIHILEPWHNLNRLEQVIGRGIRNCSHASLPFSHRNVTIYLYASTCPKSLPQSKRLETIDLYTYRIAEKKSFKIAKVTNILKRNAIDCLIAKNYNTIKEEDRFKNVEIINSKNVKLTVDLYDKKFSRACNYMDCEYKCYPEREVPSIKMDNDTYSIIYAQDDISKVKKIVKDMFKSRFVYTLKDIINNVKNIENKFIIKAVDSMVDNKNDVVYDLYNRDGYIIQQGLYYMFQPFMIDDKTLPLYYRRRPVSIKNNKFNIDNFIDNEYRKIVKRKFVEKDINISEINEFRKVYTLEKFINNDIMRKMYIDRVGYVNLKHLLKWVVLNYINNKNRPLKKSQDEFNDFIFKQYNKHFIRNHHLERVKNKDNIIGFYIANEKNVIEYYYYSNNVFKKFNILDSNKIKNNLNKKKRLPLADVVGFLYRLNKNIDIKMQWDKDDIVQGLIDTNIDIVMKVRDRTKNKKNTGYLAYQPGKLSKLIKLMKTLDKSFKRKNEQKKVCYLLEKILRKYDLERKDGKRWFLSLEEGIQRNLIKKK